MEDFPFQLIVLDRDCQLLIVGDVHLGNDIAVGANAVITKSFLEDKITLGGVPAKKISNHSSRDFLADGLFEN